LVKRGLDGADTVIHLAAETGTGQSMYAPVHHFAVNTLGTAILLEEAAATRSVSHIVLASSRAVYGEGAYRCAEHGIFSGASRRVEDLQLGLYEVRCPRCGEFAVFAPTTEDSLLDPQSIYGLTKYDLEKTALFMLRSPDKFTAILRCQNVYGPGQSLTNPYTGILAVFSSLARAGEEILIFEDGLETRDFIYVSDVVDALVGCSQAVRAGYLVLNVGTGVATPVIEVARQITDFFGSRAPMSVSYLARAGDVRHNVADVSRAFETLNLRAKIAFSDGVKRFLEWAHARDLPKSQYRRSLEELSRSGLFIRKLI
jgi:dTDP-L-rhamnose 4-epimerase